MVTVTDAGKMGIGASVPDGTLHVVTTESNGMISERATTAATGAPPYLVFRRNNSASVDANGAVGSGNGLGAVVFTGNTGNGYEANVISGTSMIIGYASENFTSTAQGSEIRFHTVPNGTATSLLRMTLGNDGRVGIGRVAATNILEIAGEASKSTTGGWLANSDGRLKKDVQQISGEEALNKLLKLKGVYYYWDDKKTGIERPDEKQMGFIAQNIQEVFPEKVSTDSKGYLQTAYGDYDAVIVEAIRALNSKIDKLEKENIELKSKIESLKH
ncbi:tail fiber domain-containing protein [Chryseobacterium oryctis]|uniref:Tail fiber domain-containing protein n=1 Tax=Chryseobacterium oryctis TaxID=2952618 RepID=A0ABT3HKL5_9FLAO|nr:tail fiber domain-containing protein [Chryseobacterium oryctis]MCW3160338.1 tail fiber domain-containing protein [Chryseobacterium oryctis]